MSEQNKGSKSRRAFLKKGSFIGLGAIAAGAATYAGFAYEKGNTRPGYAPILIL